METIIFSLGIALLAYALLAYEDEQKRATNYLEGAWIKLYDTEKIMSQRVIEALKETALVTDRILSRLYGEKILSKRALFASASMSLGTGLFLIAVFYPWYLSYLQEGGVEQELLDIAFIPMWMLTIMIFLSILLIVTPIVVNKTIVIAMTLISVVLLVSYELSNQLSDMMGVNTVAALQIDQLMNEMSLPPIEWLTVIWFILIVIVSAYLDYYCIAFTRSRIERAKDANGLFGFEWLIFQSIIFSFLLLMFVPILAWAPLLFGMWPEEIKHYMFLYILAADSTSYTWLFNLFPVLISFVFIILVILAIIYSMIWAVIPRSVYQVLQLKILENKKAITAIALSMIGFSFPILRNLISSVLKTVL